ncbi:peptidoglycan D,D-transpeptidase FtsI family protein [Aurantiacibacter sediminis]|uniref:Penicillin-binding protein 2 n=1 Tax=Aurantiacibacter sediminis TaxID=2793064 RepID=A0ABS0N6A3_9SPHN|nr:penicillin-binding transpeptidase domain-containing protein [Aurantiacibacter sediminis]MBH5323285.1 penicillin-binding protein 2 [Aurantiacibacter sediminis]
MTSFAAPHTIIPRPAGQIDHRRRSLLIARLRILLVVVVFVLVAAVALLKLAYIGVAEPGSARQSMADQLLPPRGEITDRNGVPLARAFPAYALWFNPDAMSEGGDGGPPLIGEPGEIAQQLRDIFPDLDVQEVTEMLASGERGYIRRRILPEDANRVRALGELALELPQEEDRHYPQGSMAAHVLGYVGADGHGRVGMEEVLDEQLLDPARRDQSVALSIDMRAQGALEDELRRGMLSVNAVGAAGIVLDVDTGEVLALASLPEFDPNDVQSSDVRVTQEQHDRGITAPAFNRVTNQVYELGSTFKPLTVAAAIDSGSITNIGRRYSATPYQVQGATIRDLSNYGTTLNAPEMLIHSSNVVTGHIVDEMGADTLRQYMVELGMNERPYIELPARGFPLWQSGEWSRIRGVTVGYGHGIAVTPLHLASAYAAMVNGGIWRPATLHRLGPGEAPRGRRVFKASTSARMNQLLRMIAVYGTGRNADAPGFRVGGKTGSAEKPGAGGYRQTTLVSTFAAAFPMDDPRYVVIVMLDEPQGTVASSYQRTAAWNAAPIVGRLVPRIGPQLGVYPDADRDIDLSDLRPLVGDTD